MALTTGTAPDIYLGAVEGGKRNFGRASILQYCEDCKDATFSSISLKNLADGSAVKSPWNFKQYYLRYYGHVEFTDQAQDISITLVPQTCLDMEKVSITVNGVPVQVPGSTNWCSGSNTFNAGLKPGTNEIRIRGEAKVDHNWVEYVYTIEKEANPVPERITLGFSAADGANLPYSPAFSRAIAGPYVIEGGVSAATEEIFLLPDYSPGVDVFVSGEPAASGLRFPIRLLPGSNEIAVTVKAGSSSSSHTFTILRLVGGDVPVLPLHQVAMVSPTSDFSVQYLAVVDQGRDYSLVVNGTVEDLWIKRASGNANVILVNGTELVGNSAVSVPVPDGESRISIIEMIAGGQVRKYTVKVIRNIELNGAKRISVGFPERIPGASVFEPAGFYSYPDIESAYASVKNEVEYSPNPNELPFAYEFFVFPAFGDDMIVPNPNEIERMFGPDAVIRSLGVSGIRKGTQAYQEMMDEYNSSL